MSFPSKLSTSPLLQRDYALLGNRPLHNAQSPPATRRNGRQETDAASRVSGSVNGDQDTVSSLSLHDGDEREDAVHPAAAEEASQSRGVAIQTPRGDSNQPTSAHQISPFLGPTSFGDYSRGNRMANLHQQLSSAAAQHQQRRRASVDGHAAASAGAPHSPHADRSGFSQVGFYILGGHHAMPPADADMRSQEQLDEESQSSIDVFLPPPHLQDDHNEDEDDITPRPGKHASSSDFFNHKSGASKRESRVSVSETSPLLQSSGNSRGAAAANGNAYYTHGINGNEASPHAQPRRPSLQAHSAFDSRQPAPPGQEQIDAMGRESDAHLHRRELSVLLQFAVPIWLTHLLELSLNVVSVFSIGHLGTNELAAASLSSMTANVTGFSVLAGFISALDSMLPSAYTSKPKMVGLYTQRMLVIVVALLVPICITWLNTERILLALGQDPLVASLAASYLRILVIGLPGYAGFEVCRRYLQAQNLMHAPTIVLLVASPINAFLTWLFVWGPEKVRFGFIGAPLASTFSMWLMFLLGVTQCYIAPRVAWDGWTRLAFTGLRPLLELGTAGMFAMCAEWWAWEVVGLITSRLGTVALAAQSVLLVCSSISYQLPYAISVAAAVRVGNLLGATQAHQAKISSQMSMLLSMGAGAFNSTLFFAIRNQLGTFFSQDERVIELISLVVPVMAAFQIMDGVTGVASGILRGTGRQKAGAVISLTGYYVVGIPIGILLTFGPPQMGLWGLWLGLTIALLYSTIFSFLIIKRTNWNLEVSKTLARMASDQSAIKVPIDEEGGVADEDDEEERAAH